MKNLAVAALFGLSLGLSGCVISVDGDDILCSVSGMRRIYDKIMSKSSEYVKTRGYPFGMNSFGIESKFIKKCLKKKLNQILY